MQPDDAWEDLTKFLQTGEVIEAAVLGGWGWDSFGGDDEPGYGEEYIPEEFRLKSQDKGRVIGPQKLQELTANRGWSFYGGYGSPKCYAIYVWTNRRVIWVTQYDGSTSLTAAPRNPVDTMPGMPGG